MQRGRDDRQRAPKTHKQGSAALREEMEAVAHNQKKGFNLIEAAIVLAVVGAVLGTIWGVSAHFYEEYKVNKTVSDLTQIARNIQNLISLRDAETLGDDYSLDTFLTTSGVVPKDWIIRNYAVHPLSRNGTLQSRTYIAPTYSNFNLQLFELNKRNCINLVVRLSSLRHISHGQKVRGEWTRIQVNYTNSPSSDFSYFPISIEQATTACHDETTNSVYIYYPFYQHN